MNRHELIGNTGNVSTTSRSNMKNASQIQFGEENVRDYSQGRDRSASVSFDTATPVSKKHKN